MLVGPVTFLPTFVRYSENAVFEFEFGSGGDWKVLKEDKFDVSLFIVKMERIDFFFFFLLRQMIFFLFRGNSHNIKLTILIVNYSGI